MWTAAIGIRCCFNYSCGYNRWILSGIMDRLSTLPTRAWSRNAHNLLWDVHAEMSEIFSGMKGNRMVGWLVSALVGGHPYEGFGLAKSGKYLTQPLSSVLSCTLGPKLENVISRTKTKFMLTHWNRRQILCAYLEKKLFLELQKGWFNVFITHMAKKVNG